MSTQRASAVTASTTQIETAWKLEPKPAEPLSSTAESVLADADRLTGREASVAAAAQPGGNDSQRLPKLPKAGGPFDKLPNKVQVRRFGDNNAPRPDFDSQASLVDPARYTPRSELRAPNCHMERNAIFANGNCETSTLTDVRVKVGDHWSIGGQGGRDRLQLAQLDNVAGFGNAYAKFIQADVRYSVTDPQSRVRPYIEGGAGFARYHTAFDGDGLLLGQRQRNTGVVGRLTAGTTVNLGNDMELDVGAEVRHGAAFNYMARGVDGRNIALSNDSIRTDKRVFARFTVGVPPLDEIFDSRYR